MGKVTTSTGIELSVKGISRKVIDAFLLYRSPPEPPLKTIKIYGGLEEQVPDYEAESYKREYEHYVTAMAQDQFLLIAYAVTFDVNPYDNKMFNELIQVGVIEPSNKEEANFDFLRFVAMEQVADSALVMNEVLYLSTVTQEGIEEAGDLFNVTWHSKRVELFGIPRTNARFTQHFEDRSAAKYAGVPWTTFIELTGPEQSAIVAHYRVSQRLDWLLSQQKRK